MKVLKGFMDSIIKSSWLKHDLKKIVQAKDSHPLVSDVVLQLYDGLYQPINSGFYLPRSQRRRLYVLNFNLPPL
jgi:hypothetical protein